MVSLFLTTSPDVKFSLNLLCKFLMHEEFWNIVNLTFFFGLGKSLHSNNTNDFKLDTENSDSFIHSFLQHLLNPSIVPGTVQDAWGFTSEWNWQRFLPSWRLNYSRCLNKPLCVSRGVAWLLPLYTGCNLPQFFWLFSPTPLQNKNKVFKPSHELFS